MYLYNEEQIVPQYAFEPDTVVGNQMIRVTKGDGVLNYKKSDFLIPHRKGYYFMAFIKEGFGRHWIDMTPYTLKTNTFYFTHPHQVHLKEETTPIVGMTINFNLDFVASDNNGVLKELPIIQNPHNGHELFLSEEDLVFVEDITEKIYAEYSTKHSWQHNMLMAYMKILLIYLSRLYTEQFSPTENSQDKILLKRYLSKIEESYATAHEVSAYAEMLNISAGHLSELVKEQSGKPAIVHIHERLILEAKRLLFHTDSPIKEIAYHLGFEDASYFNRFFKRLTNYTPVGYRDNFREKYH